MNLSKLKSWHSLVKLLVLALMVNLGVGCTDLDETFGSEYTPSSQELSLQTMVDTTSFITTLYVSDSIRSSNIGLGVLGVENRFGFGKRTSAYYTQFIPNTELNEDDDDDWDENYPWGYEPIFDSLIMYISVASYSGDTTVSQTFSVYEAMDVDFLNHTMDSVYFSDFDTSNLNLTGDPLFTFTFPDYDNEIYLRSTSVRLHSTGTPEAESFIERMLLMDADANNDIYDFDYREEFLDKFRGIYIKPNLELTSTPSEELESVGATYSFYIDGSGLVLYARSRYEEDPSIIKDTVKIGYSFRALTSYLLDDAYYGISINTVEREPTYVLDTPTSTLRVEGMGGVASKITITKDLFEKIEAKLAEVTDNNGDTYNSIFVNRANLKIYLPEESTADYDSSNLDPLTITPWLNDAPYRLGMYNRYVDYYYDYDDYDDDISMLEGISDYYYEYELYYSVVLPYNGYLNRSFGCYEMTISAQLQDAWNSYLDAKEAAGGDPALVDWDQVEDCSFILAPVADNLFSTQYATLQGMSDGSNNAPLKLSLTYTLIK